MARKYFSLIPKRLRIPLLGSVSILWIVAGLGFLIYKKRKSQLEPEPELEGANIILTQVKAGQSKQPTGIVSSGSSLALSGVSMDSSGTLSFGPGTIGSY